MWIQRGENSKYPVEVDCWRLEDGNPPEWITDFAKISGIDPNTGKLQITIRESNKGYEIVSADGKNMFIFVNNRDSFICKDITKKYSKPFILTEKQRDLLYKEKEKH